MPASNVTYIAPATAGSKTGTGVYAGLTTAGAGNGATFTAAIGNNSVTFNQVSTLDGQHWVSEFGNDHGLGTFPLQASGTNLGYFPPIRTNKDYGFQTFGAAASLDQAGTTIGHFNSPEDYSWDISVQRQLGRSTGCGVKHEVPTEVVSG